MGNIKCTSGSVNFNAQARVFNFKKISIMLLCMAVFFIKVSAQQQPACNLSGPLTVNLTPGNDNEILFQSEVFNSSSGTSYNWELKTNTSGATIISGQSTPSLKLSAGIKGGSITIQLSVKNTDKDTGKTASCTCSQSVTVISNNP